MNKILCIGLLLFIAACSSSVSKKEKNVIAEKTIILKTYSIRAGEVKRVSYESENFIKDTEFSCKWGVFPAYYENGQYHAYIAESYFSKFEDYTCNLVQDGDVKGEALNIVVSDRPFPIETLYVNPRRITLSKKDRERVEKEQAMLNLLYKTSSPVPLFSSDFQLPLNSKVTSYYGVKRIYNGTKKGQHLGTDFRAAIGVKLPTANSGRVVFAGDLFYTGKTVIIDHGLNIFTVYGHLSKLLAVAGEYVPKGAIIGRSGATGRVSGPHLHWGVKVNGHYIDGVSMINETRFLNPSMR